MNCPELDNPDKLEELEKIAAIENIEKQQQEMKDRKRSYEGIEQEIVKLTAEIEVINFLRKACDRMTTVDDVIMAKISLNILGVSV